MRFLKRFLVNLARRREERILYDMLTLGAGYDIGLLGHLTLRSTDQETWEVEQEIIQGTPAKAPRCVSTYYDEASKTYCWSFDNPVDAIKFFLEIRHKEEVGIDYEFLHIEEEL